MSSVASEQDERYKASSRSSSAETSDEQPFNDPEMVSIALRQIDGIWDQIGELDAPTTVIRASCLKALLFREEQFTYMPHVAALQALYLEGLHAPYWDQATREPESLTRAVDLQGLVQGLFPMLWSKLSATSQLVPHSSILHPRSHESLLAEDINSAHFFARLSQGINLFGEATSLREPPTRLAAADFSRCLDIDSISIVGQDLPLINTGTVEILLTPTKNRRTNKKTDGISYKWVTGPNSRTLTREAFQIPNVAFAKLHNLVTISIMFPKLYTHPESEDGGMPAEALEAYTSVLYEALGEACPLLDSYIPHSYQAALGRMGSTAGVMVNVEAPTSNDQTTQQDTTAMRNRLRRTTAWYLDLRPDMAVDIFHTIRQKISDSERLSDVLGLPMFYLNGYQLKLSLRKTDVNGTLASLQAQLPCIDFNRIANEADEYQCTFDVAVQYGVVEESEHLHTAVWRIPQAQLCALGLGGDFFRAEKTNMSVWGTAYLGGVQGNCHHHVAKQIGVTRAVLYSTTKYSYQSNSTRNLTTGPFLGVHPPWIGDFLKKDSATDHYSPYVRAISDHFGAAAEISKTSHQARVELRLNDFKMVPFALQQLHDIETLNFFLRRGAIATPYSQDVALWNLAQVLLADEIVRTAGHSQLITPLALTWAVLSINAVSSKPRSFMKAERAVWAATKQAVLLKTRGRLLPGLFAPLHDRTGLNVFPGDFNFINNEQADFVPLCQEITRDYWQIHGHAEFLSDRRPQKQGRKSKPSAAQGDAQQGSGTATGRDRGEIRKNRRTLVEYTFPKKLPSQQVMALKVLCVVYSHMYTCVAGSRGSSQSEQYKRKLSMASEELLVADGQEDIILEKYSTNPCVSNLLAESISIAILDHRQFNDRQRQTFNLLFPQDSTFNNELSTKLEDWPAALQEHEWIQEYLTVVRHFNRKGRIVARAKLWQEFTRIKLLIPTPMKRKDRRALFIARQQKFVFSAEPPADETGHLL